MEFKINENAVKRMALNPDMMSQWAELAHSFCLDSLMAESSWTCNQVAFHGGTSLHLSWNSPRYSEDLDFLLSKEVGNIDGIIDNVEESIRQKFRAISPNFDVEIKDKTRDAERMPNYTISVTHKGYVGSAKVKMEFWRVDKEYLEKYPTEFKSPVTQFDNVARVYNPVPAATLETAYCDKLTAFATRPFLKWRDIYDLWWIGNQSNSIVNEEAITDQFLHNLSAYNTLKDLPPHEALRLFLNNDRQALIDKADPDLKRWVPVALWEKLNPDEIPKMVDYVMQSIEKVANNVEQVYNQRKQLEPK